MNEFRKFAGAVSADQARLRAVIERSRAGKGTVGDILSLPEHLQAEAWAAVPAFVPENSTDERRGFNEDHDEPALGWQTDGDDHTQWGE